MNSFSDPTDDFLRIVNKPKTTTSRSAPSSPNRNTNGQLIQMTTPRPSKPTTINSFWDEWSADKPTNIGANEVDRHSAHAHDSNQQTTPTTTPAMDPWLLAILNDYSSTTTTRSQFNQNDHEFHTTSNDVDKLPVWMRDIINGLSTTTTRRNIRFENDNGGGGSNSNGDLHRPKQNRYSTWIMLECVNVIYLFNVCAYIVVSVKCHKSHCHSLRIYFI